MATRLLDIYLFEGDSFLFRAALGILKYLQDELLLLDFDGMIRVLHRLSLRVRFNFSHFLILAFSTPLRPFSFPSHEIYSIFDVSTFVISG